MSRQDTVHITFENGMHLRFKPKPFIPTPNEVEVIVRLNPFVKHVDR